MRARFSIPLALLLGAVWASAALPQPLPSSRVLAPAFEVDLYQPGRLSTFSVSNDAEVPVEVDIGVYTNWGIRVLGTTVEIGPNAVHSCDLTRWIVDGELPDRTLGPGKLAHVQAALTGKPSPKDGLYYATELEPDRATGYVLFRVKGEKAPDSLWGDYFVRAPSDEFEQAETLVNLDRSVRCYSCCRRQAIRFKECTETGVATDLHLWTAVKGTPQPTPEPPESQRVPFTLFFFDEQGNLVDRHDLRVDPQSRIDVCDLGIPEPFGWVEIFSEEEFFVTGHYTFEAGASAALHGYCLPEALAFDGPAIELEKRTYGMDADTPPGVHVLLGGPVQWTFEVVNVGTVPLSDVVVTDSIPGVDVACPADALAPGERMTCTAEGIAEVCRYRNVGTVTGFAPDGSLVSDDDPSHYHASTGAALSLEKRTNGHDADDPPGPVLPVGEPIQWTYEVTNTGTAAITDLAVSDSKGVAVSCPKSDLDPGESMVCTGSGISEEGEYENVGQATGRDDCGVEISASDPSHYVGWMPRPAVDLQKLTNGLDADSPTGPTLTVGERVTWSYEVTNIGNESLHNLAVTDDRGVAVSCPRTTLALGASMTCTGHGNAVVGQYANLGTVTGTGEGGSRVSDTDPSHYLGLAAAVDIEKSVQGHDADLPPGPEFRVGDPLVWAFVVSNRGDVPLHDVTVTDNSGLVPACPRDTLAVGATMTCQARSVAAAGQHENVATVVGIAPAGGQVTDSDPCHYVGSLPRPAVDLEKYTNGHDADSPTGPTLVVGEAVTWSYEVMNTGQEALHNLTVTDDRGVAVSCPKTTLAPGASMTCAGHGNAVVGQYANLGTVTGTGEGGTGVSDTDPSHYLGLAAAVDIEKYVQGHDADFPPGPEFWIGDSLVWTFVVSNRGDVPLHDVTVTDDSGLVPRCPHDTLAVGATMTCRAESDAAAGQHENVATVVGITPAGGPVTDTDPCHYFGKKKCYKGCSPGYWKWHLDSWHATGYSTSQSVASVFPSAAAYPGIGSATLREALFFGGGSGTEGAARTLLRAGVAALLNAAHPSVNYPESEAGVIASVDQALASGDRGTMLSLASVLDTANNQGCPLDD